MNNWVKGTNFPDHFVNSSDPTIQVVLVGDYIEEPEEVMVYALPKDYTMLDQLYDQEANNTFVSPMLKMEAERAAQAVGETLARQIVVIDNTQSPPRMLQIPKEDGGFPLPNPPFHPLERSSVTPKELYE